MPRFPLDIKVLSFDATGDMRQFGAYRKPTRLHAGCDLYAPRGTPVRAIADGTFQQREYFDLGTDEVLIHHPGIGLVRYLELMQAKHYPAEKRWLERENGGEAPAAAPDLTKGVAEGDVIGHVGELVASATSSRGCSILSSTTSGPSARTSAATAARVLTAATPRCWTRPRCSRPSSRGAPRQG